MSVLCKYKGNTNVWDGEIEPSRNNIDYDYDHKLETRITQTKGLSNNLKPTIITREDPY